MANRVYQQVFDNTLDLGRVNVRDFRIGFHNDSALANVVGGLDYSLDQLPDVRRAKGRRNYASRQPVDVQQIRQQVFELSCVGGQAVKKIGGPGLLVRAAIFRPDGDAVAAASNGAGEGLFVWNRIPRRAVPFTLPPRSTSVTEPNTRDPAGIATRPLTSTSRVTRASTRSSSRARSDDSAVSTCNPITEEAGSTSSSK